MDGFATFNRRLAQAFAHCNDGIFYRSRITLARMQRAALIESMFGVTTSDDYRPVAWMGRYPVDVTTMLVGLHVAAAVFAAILVAFGAGSVLAWMQFHSASHDLGALATVCPRWFAGLALWNFCCLCNHLSARRVVPADYGKMGCPHPCSRLHASTARVSRLERSGRRLDKYWRGVPVHRMEWCRAGARLVERLENALRSQAEVSRRTEDASDTCCGFGRCLCLDRSHSR